MPAYMIVTATISDREAFLSGYGAKAAALVERFGGQYLMRAPGAQLLEGGFGDGGSVVISQWPSREAALAFWNSPEYGEARTLRQGVADCQVLLIEAPAIAS
ncbi:MULTISPECIES: DUF1330 domain-containing protein [Sphingobium]|uniref:DUF1330 domain-containing protein n=1 Tax=Sphingobium chungbukense TaxID=56193 RepID=A0A0M3AQB5_9SPHN|nr:MULTISPECIES: DUF1330 domain-containing protein [Sphingobium]KKW90714.1 hypothetical protein YP76_19365 [Sphingobium chungbukense]PJG46638.1 hypothetical protein CAF53_21100 [Sphingobium sp. LB126]